MSASEPPPPPPPGGPGDPGGYGGPPPGGYGAPPPAGPSGYNVGDAFSYGWSKFQKHVGQIIVAILVLWGAVLAVEIVGFLVGQALQCDPQLTITDSGALENSCDGGLFTLAAAASLFFGALSFVVAMIVGAGIIRGALDLTEGRDLEPRRVLSTDQLGPVVVASLLVGLATFVGLVLCILPGIAIIFLTQYTIYFVVDKGLSPVEAIRASINLTTSNFGNAFVWWLLGGLVALIGFAVCFVGALVTIPVVLIGTAYTYKVLTGQDVVD